MTFNKWETYEINLIRACHGAAITNAQISDVLKERLEIMNHDQWSRPSNRRAGEILDVENLIKKLDESEVPA